MQKLPVKTSNFLKEMYKCEGLRRAASKVTVNYCKVIYFTQEKYNKVLLTKI